MDNLYLFVAKCGFKLIRSLHFVDLYYNETTKRFERHRQSPIIRRRIHRPLFAIVTMYSIVMLSLPIRILYNMAELARRMGEYALIGMTSITVTGFTSVIKLTIILYQFERRSTSKFLNNFYNKIIDLHEEVATLPNFVVNTEFYTHIHLLLLLKFLLLIWICVAVARDFTFYLNDFIGSPIFELAFFGRFMIMWKFLRFHQNLNHFVRKHKKQLKCTERCTQRCEEINEPFLHALTLWWQSQQLFTCFLERFRWFQRIALSEKILTIFLSNHMLMCLYCACYTCTAHIPKFLVLVLDALLIALINDNLKNEENTLQDILIIIVGKLTKRGLLCAHCNDLLYVIDLRLCDVNLRENHIQIFHAFFLTRVCVLKFIGNAVLIGINMAQFEWAAIHSSNCGDGNV